jgi:hypothetical protein
MPLLIHLSGRLRDNGATAVNLEQVSQYDSLANSRSTPNPQNLAFSTVTPVSEGGGLRQPCTSPLGWLWWLLKESFRVRVLQFLDKLGSCIGVAFNKLCKFTPHSKCQFEMCRAIFTPHASSRVLSGQLKTSDTSRCYYWRICT